MGWYLYITTPDEKRSIYKQSFELIRNLDDEIKEKEELLSIFEKDLLIFCAMCKSVKNDEINDESSYLNDTYDIIQDKIFNIRKFITETLENYRETVEELKELYDIRTMIKYNDFVAIEDTSNDKYYIMDEDNEFRECNVDEYKNYIKKMNELLEDEFD